MTLVSELKAKHRLAGGGAGEYPQLHLWRMTAEHREVRRDRTVSVHGGGAEESHPLAAAPICSSGPAVVDTRAPRRSAALSLGHESHRNGTNSDREFYLARPN